MTLVWVIALLLIIGDYQRYEREVHAFIEDKKAKVNKSKAQKFYSSTAWRKARHECFRLQMVRTKLKHIECEVCGSTSMDLDDSGKKIVMSVGHDKARSTHEHLALKQSNLFPQCMPCNLGQGVETRLITG
jgi:5-methylcytosine-specific restriction endonuclease McrA